ncbi:MAG: DUF6807 family protein [Thermoguttaceae bacterium]
MRTRAVNAILLLAVAASPAWAEGPLRAVQNETFLVIFSGGTPVLQYRHDSSPYKPYIKELFTPGGVQVLRDAPADHLHHHGVMFAVAADGVTFWTETPEGGRQVSRGLAASAAAASPGQSRISFTQQLDWTAPGAEAPTLEEQRTIEVVQAEGLAPTMVTWTTRLSPAGGRRSVELTGEHYYGLGCRLLQSLDKTGRFVYAAGEPGPIVRGKERVTPSAWCAYVVPAEGAQATVAIFDHPGNPRHPAAMFTMPEQFAYLAATLNLWKEPLTLEAEKPLSLVYGVAVWDGQADAEEIERAFQRWGLLSAKR